MADGSLGAIDRLHAKMAALADAQPDARQHLLPSADHSPAQVVRAVGIKLLRSGMLDSSLTFAIWIAVSSAASMHRPSVHFLSFGAY